MTEKNMNKLADLLISRIKRMQQELDQEYFDKIQLLNQGYDITDVHRVEDSADTIAKETKVLIEQLEVMLVEAVNTEQFELAAELTKKIKDLKK
jgi:excinuclease UvrABC helicase subunit UvrB